MTTTQLTASRLLWLNRERRALRKWKFHRYESKDVGSKKNLALRQKHWDAYEEARKNRVRRDKQLVERRQRVTGVSDACVELVAEFEGFSSKPYRDPVGIWTIGYGETRGVGPRTQPVTKTYAKAQLRKRLNEDYFPYVARATRPGKLTQNVADAFTSFVYNVGPGGVAVTSGVGRALRAGNIKLAANRLLQWDKAGGRVLPGLTRRRKAERYLALK